jgi:protein-S-isoprenylcysteine O-methyltransferase Ste14
VAPLPYSEPAAQIPFYAVLIVFFLLEQRIRFKSRINPSGERRDHGSHPLLILFVGVGIGAGFVLASSVPSAAIPDARWALFVLGLILMCTGIAIRQWAIVTLGNFFTVDVRVHPGQTVIEGGPYRWVRHPAYTGLILTIIGIGLALGNWLALLVLAIVPTIGLVARIHFEERALLNELGEPYRRFAATRARLFPGLW